MRTGNRVRTGASPDREACRMARERVNEIDLMRFIAAMIVVFFHYAFRGHAGGKR